jgi:hypothetical protein
MKKSLVVGLLLASMILVTSAVFGQAAGDDYAYRTDKFYIDLGGFLTSVNTSASVNSEIYGRGTSVDFEKNLGLKDNPLVWRLDAGWRFTDRQQLAFSYYQINRNASKALTSDFNWGDYTFLAGSGAKASWDSNFYQLYWRIAFVQGAKGEFGGTAGISYLNQKASIAGWTTIRTQGASTAYYRERSNTLNAPIPVIGLFGVYQFTPKFYMKGDIQYLKVNVSGVDGAYTDARLVFDYYPWKNVGFGLGWYYDKYDVTANKSGFDGDFTYDFNGPAAYISFKF